MTPLRRGAAEAKAANLSVRLTSAQKDWLRTYAEQLTAQYGYRISVSAVATRLLREAMERGV